MSCHIILHITAYHAVCFLKLRTTERELNIDFNKGTLIAVLGYPTLITATCLCKFTIRFFSYVLYSMNS